MKITKQKVPMVRPVRCRVCRERMYYSGNPQHEPELQILVVDNLQTSESFYVHTRCWDRMIALIDCKKD